MTTTTMRTKPTMSVVPDDGCQYAPKCVTYPWSGCMKELSLPEGQAFTAALALVRGYLAEPDAVSSP